MPDLTASISRVLGDDGMLGAVLIDGTTGLCYGMAGDPAMLPEPEECAETVHLIVSHLCDAAGDGELESVIVTTDRHLFLTRVIPRPRGDDLLLAAVADRAHTNVALAARQLDAQADSVLQ